MTELTRDAARLAMHLADIFGPRPGVDWDEMARGLRFLLFADGYEIAPRAALRSGDRGQYEYPIGSGNWHPVPRRRRPLPEDRAAPTAADLYGLAPGITGGLSSEEYVRRLRSGEEETAPDRDMEAAEAAHVGFVNPTTDPAEVERRRIAWDAFEQGRAFEHRWCRAATPDTPPEARDRLDPGEIAALTRYAALNPDEYVAGDRTLTLDRITASLAAGVTSKWDEGHAFGYREGHRKGRAGVLPPDTPAPTHPVGCKCLDGTWCAEMAFGPDDPRQAIFAPLTLDEAWSDLSGALYADDEETGDYDAVIARHRSIIEALAVPPPAAPGLPTLDEAWAEAEAAAREFGKGRVVTLQAQAGGTYEAGITYPTFRAGSFVRTPHATPEAALRELAANLRAALAKTPGEPHE